MTDTLFSVIKYWPLLALNEPMVSRMKVYLTFDALLIFHAKYFIDELVGQPGRNAIELLQNIRIGPFDRKI